MEKYEEVERKSFGKILWHNFLGGVAWGLGVTIGLSVVLALAGYFFNNFFQHIDFVPIVGEFLKKVTLYIDQTSPKPL